MTHVFPIGDIEEHDTTGTTCWCVPEIIEVYSEIIIIHNAFDGRTKENMKTNETVKKAANPACFLGAVSNSFTFWFWKNAPNWIVKRYIKKNIKDMDAYEQKKADILAKLKTKLTDSKCQKHHVAYDYYNNKPVCPICNNKNYC